MNLTLLLFPIEPRLKQKKGMILKEKKVTLILFMKPRHIVSGMSNKLGNHKYHLNNTHAYNLTPGSYE
jgi:hypothetical protein